MRDFILVEDLDDAFLQKCEDEFLSKGLLTLDNTPQEHFIAKELDDGLLYIIMRNKTQRTQRADGSIQCQLDKNRSTGDLLRITKSYYPHLTLKALRQSLFRLANDYKLTTFVCWGIGKRVWFVGDTLQVVDPFVNQFVHDKNEPLPHILKTKIINNDDRSSLQSSVGRKYPEESSELRCVDRSLH